MKMALWLKTVCSCLWFIPGGDCWYSPGHFWHSDAQAAVITLAPGTHYQTVTGWEATVFAGQDEPAFPNYKDELFDLAINDLGINRVRLEIRSGVENDTDYYQLYHTGAIDYATWRAHRYATVNDNGDPNSTNLNGFHFTEMDARIEDTVLPLRQLAQARGEPLWVNLNYVAFTGRSAPVWSISTTRTNTPSSSWRPSSTCRAIWLRPRHVGNLARAG
jgi:hypothetical protein